jgi:hypothetical protein
MKNLDKKPNYPLLDLTNERKAILNISPLPDAAAKRA